MLFIAEMGMGERPLKMNKKLKMVLVIALLALLILALFIFFGLLEMANEDFGR